MLTTADGALRHLIYTIVNIPETAKPKLTLTLTETVTSRIARSIFVILLLLDETQEPVVNAETATHLWYSRELPEPLFRHFQRVTAAKILRQCQEVKEQYDGGRLIPDSLCTLQLGDNTNKLELELSGKQWKELAGYVFPPKKIDEVRAAAIRNLDLATNTNHPVSYGAKMTPARAVSMMYWRFAGRLAPSGQPWDESTVLNP